MGLATAKHSVEQAIAPLTPNLGCDCSVELATLGRDPEYIGLRVRYEESDRLHRGYLRELRNMLGGGVSVECCQRLKERMKNLIGACRQRLLWKAPTDRETDEWFDAVVHALEQVSYLLGCNGDAVAGGGIARTRRMRSGGLSNIREYQATTEDMLWSVLCARHSDPPRDLNASRHDKEVSAAKISMAAGIAELLEECGIPPTTTTGSPYLQLVEWALAHADPKTPGDEKKIAAKGLRAWRGQDVC